MRRSLLCLLLCVATSVSAVAQDGDDPPPRPAADAAPQLQSLHIEPTQLTLTFDQPMVTWSTAGDAPALQLTPAADCLWAWMDDVELACTMTPGTSFAVAQPYRLAIGAGLGAQNGVPLAPTSRAFVSRPPAPSLQVRDWHDGRPELVLVSDQRLDEASLREHLVVTLAGAAVPYRLEAVDKASLARFYGYAAVWEIRFDAWPATPGELDVALTPGLRSLEGPAPGEARSLWRHPVNSPFALTDVVCENAYSPLRWQPGATRECTADATVRLVFSRPLDPASLAAWAKTLPAGVALAEQPTDCGYVCNNGLAGYQGVIRLVTTAAGRTLRIAVAAPLRAESGTTLATAVDADVRIADYAPEILVKPLVDVRLPAADGGVAAVRGRNLPAASWLEVAVGGRRAEATRTALAATTPRNQFAALDVPALDRRIAAHGGLVLGGLASAAGDADWPLRNAARATAVAAFALVAVPEAGRTLVWASDWASAAPLAGVDVALVALDRDGVETVLARARTGADGSAWLAHPQDGDAGAATGRIDADAGFRLLRAVHRGGVSVLPLENTAANAGTGLDGVVATEHWDDTPGGDRLRWGATSRLLYRPGDTVEWRLWLRDRRGLALRRPIGDTATLQLSAVGRRQRVHEVWTAPLDEWGSVAGTTSLPETLEDGLYCIAEQAARRGWGADTTGACFEVARFDAPSLWATLQADDVVRLRGEIATLQGEGGFYSGGAAAHAGATLSGVATPARLEAAYPALARWEFLDADGGYVEGGDPLEDLALPNALDAAGKVAFALPLPARLPGEDEHGEPVALDFARLQFNLAVDDEGKARASSPTAAFWYAAHERYVGLHADGWIAIDADPVLEAVVATHRGELLVDRAVTLRLETLGDEPQVLGTCALRSGAAQACALRAPKPGLYALVADAEGAASARIRRWFGDRPPTVAAEEKPPVTLELATAASAGAPARLTLRQPHAQASALVLVEHEGVLTHWRQTVGPQAEIVVPVRPEWTPGVSVRVLLRPQAASAQAGLAAETRVAMLRLDVPRGDLPALALTLAADELAPGAEATLVLENPHDAPRLVTLAIVDDAVHQQADDLRPLLDPDGPQLLGRLQQWRIGDWLALEHWERLRNPFFRVDVPEVPMPAAVLGSAAPPAPPPPPEPGADAFEIETIEVTGSRLKRADIVDAGSATEPGEYLPRVDTGPAGPVAERVRSRFPDTAYWNPGVVLAAGERREIRVRLPDNLTRWRVLAWASDAGADLELHEATLQTSLVVELRTGLPALLYPGDTGEGSVSARRNADDGARLTLRATADGVGVQAATAGDGEVAAHALLVRPLALAPTQPGRIDVLAHADDGTHADALSTSVAVRSRHARLAIAQTGWLDRGEVRLAAPALPPGASESTLSVTVSPGLQAWRREWIAGLRDYPHRCWEQILSRSLGAAFALQDVRAAADWPQAQALVDEAWRVAAQYRDYGERYVYFPVDGDDGYGGDRGRGAGLALSAYTLRAYVALDALGQPAPAHLREPLQALLRRQLGQVAIEALVDDPLALDTHAAIAGALADAGALATPADADAAATVALLRGLWHQRDDLSWYGRSELVRALAAFPPLQAETDAGLAWLRGAGVRHGASRRLADPRDFSALMGSSLRDQCALVTTLATLDRSPAGVVARDEFLRGLQDLYAGGTASLDSQANAQCLLALRAAGVDLAGTPVEPIAARLRVGEETIAPRVPALPPQDADGGVRWQAPLPAGDVVLSAPPAPDLNYVAEVGYRLDLRDARAEATGMQLQRTYAVLRGGRWQAVDAGADALRVGDWVQVSLHLRVPRMRHFIAITDVVPGGWASRDVGLAGVGGADVRRVALPGSSWFATRQTGAGEVKLYAETLPPGDHVVHWYAQVTHAGTYFAAPAIAEQMYGRASRATTAPADVRIRGD